MSVYEPKISSQIYGLHVPYDQGYDAWSQRNFAKAEDKKPSGSFARADGSTIALWITDVSADFSLAGQTGQSRMQREFYTRSFNDVTLNIVGNVAGTEEYNRLALFVREHQWKALNYINQGGTGVDQTITFTLNDNTPARWKRARPIVKGSHQPWRVQGYIETIAAGATAHNVAPEFQIGFIVADTASSGNTAIWSEILEAPQSLTSFVGLVNNDVQNNNIFTGFVPIATPAPKKGGKGKSGIGKTVAQAATQTAQTWSTAATAGFGW